MNKNLIENWMKKISHNDGGLVDYGEMKDVVPPLDPGERQHLVKGGSKKGKPKDIFSIGHDHQANIYYLDKKKHKNDFLNDFEIDESIFNAANLTTYGWKKEAIPITQFKKSIIARFFDAIFG